MFVWLAVTIIGLLTKGAHMACCCPHLAAGEACEALVHAADTLVALRSKSEALAAAEAQGAELRGKLETAQQDLTLMRNTLADAGASANRAQTPPPASSAATSALQAEVGRLGVGVGAGMRVMHKHSLAAWAQCALHHADVVTPAECAWV